MDKEFLKREADRLSTDVIFLKALAGIRADALERLATASADDKTAILLFQARVAVCDSFGAELASMIRSSAEKKPIQAI
jgi:predicted AAA+ superfamily ATPase